MGDIINLDLENNKENNDIFSDADNLLKNSILNDELKKSRSIPIAELVTLGAGISSVVPKFRTIMQSTTVSSSGLYQIANAAVGDVLKQSKDGNYWGALKTLEGKSKFCKLKEVGNLDVVNEFTIPVNPTYMLMAAALFSIERDLGNIKNTVVKMLRYIELEKTSQIQGDIETLRELIEKYKYNWDNENYIVSKMALIDSIKRNSISNILFHNKKIEDILTDNSWIKVNVKVNTKLDDLIREFNLYRLTVYTFAMASFMEIMLSGNFTEENIIKSKEYIEKYSIEYRNLYTKCSVFLEGQADSSIEQNILQAVGTASNKAGKIIGSIPVIKNGPIDELLQAGGNNLCRKADKFIYDVIDSFKDMSDPRIQIFQEKMSDMIQIYNHTENIYFDNEKIYFVGA